MSARREIRFLEKSITARVLYPALVIMAAPPGALDEAADGFASLTLGKLPI